MTIWFTADTHWWHANVIQFCNRPFDSIEEMDEGLVSNWNSVVARGDVIYHLGDFAFTKNKRQTEEVSKLAKRLNGSIHLIYGNHDRDAVKRAEGFQWQGEYKRISVDGQAIVLFHYPIASWHGIHRGAWNLHGHCHGSLSERQTYKRLDVGVDVWNYRPVSLEAIRQVMEQRSFTPVDHHTESL